MVIKLNRKLCDLSDQLMIKLKSLLTEGSYNFVKGKYIQFPDGVNHCGEWLSNYILSNKIIYGTALFISVINSIIKVFLGCKYFVILFKILILILSLKPLSFVFRVESTYTHNGIKKN